MFRLWFWALFPFGLYTSYNLSQAFVFTYSQRLLIQNQYSQSFSYSCTRMSQRDLKLISCSAW